MIISPDTKRENRVPPGQHLTQSFPALHYGRVQRIDPAEWMFRIFGERSRARGRSPWRSS